MQWNILWQWGSWNWGWNDPVVDDDNGVVVGDVGAAVVVVVVAVAAVAVAVAAAVAVAVAAVAAVAAAATATRLSHFTSKIFWLGIVYPRHLLKPCGDFDFQLTHFVVVVVVVVVLVSTVVR